jgi:SAM-dependent methyltransferase
MEDGRQQVEVIKALGVQPHHSVHEFGMGMGRVAGFLVPYLKDGSYSGNDASAGRIRKGLDYLKREKGIDTDRLLVTANKDNSFDWMKGRKVDYIWCFSVFMHMPARDIEDVIKNVRRIMHEKSVFLFTYSEKNPDKPIERMGSHDWWHSTAYFRELAERYGFDMQLHTEALRRHMQFHEATRLAAYTLKPSAAR